MFISTPSELGDVEDGRKEIPPKSGKPNLLRLGLHRTDAGLSPASHIFVVTGGALSHRGGGNIRLLTSVLLRFFVFKEDMTRRF